MFQLFCNQQILKCSGQTKLYKLRQTGRVLFFEDLKNYAKQTEVYFHFIRQQKNYSGSCGSCYLPGHYAISNIVVVDSWFWLGAGNYLGKSILPLDVPDGIHHGNDDENNAE